MLSNDSSQTQAHDPAPPPQPRAVLPPFIATLRPVAPGRSLPLFATLRLDVAHFPALGFVAILKEGAVPASIAP
jgi:hypothetical protein